ncbi:hypothetical protein V8C35DRAFT_301934 [Trichoderma chlorosporum]
MDEIKALESMMKTTILDNMEALASQGLPVPVINLSRHPTLQKGLPPIANASSVTLSSMVS